VVRGIRNLEELIGRGGMIQATCRGCEKVAIFSVADLAAHFRAKGWSDAWPGFAKRLRCSGPDGCSRRNPAVAWLIGQPPPDQDPQPPKPRLVRRPERPPIGISQSDWDKAKTDSDRRRLIRIARG
jgi:hypothetical protein